MRARLPAMVQLYLFVVIFPVGFQVGPLALTTLRLMLLALVIPLAFRLLRGDFGRLQVTDGLFFGYICWSAVALFANNPGQVVTQMGSVGVEFVGGYLVGRAYIRDRESFVGLCWGLIIAVCCLLPFAFFEAVTGRPILMELLRKLPSISTPSIHSMEPRLGLERVQLTFAHAIHWGLFCSVSLALVFVGFKNSIATAWRWALSGVAAVGGALALSSGALLAIVMQVSLILWDTIFRKYPNRWWALGGLLVIAYIVVDLLSNRTPLEVFLSYATLNPSTAYWRKLIFEFGMDNVWANPLLGLGLNDWARPAWMQYNSSVDNFWLLTAMRYGIPGFLFLAGGYGWSIWKVARRDFSTDPLLRHLRLAWVFTFLGLSFTLCTVHVWTNIYSFVFFMFGSGMWLATTPPRGEDHVAAPEETRRRTMRYTRFSRNETDAGSFSSGSFPKTRSSNQ